VNIQKLPKQLAKEAKKSPAKTGTLGLLFLVAVWFWFPLVQKWMGGSKSKKPSVATAQAESPSQPSPIATPMVPQPHNWKELAKQIMTDPNMASGSMRAPDFDPFFRPEAEVAVVDSGETAHTVAKIIESTPASMGWSVTSVIAGSRPLARINNENYRIGDAIMSHGKPTDYVVQEIEPWGVVLSKKQKQYELWIDQKNASSGNRLVLRNRLQNSGDN